MLDRFEGFFSREGLELVEVDAGVIEQATDLRAKHNFRAPDAIHIASALMAKADIFLTGDRTLERCPGLTVEVLSGPRTVPDGAKMRVYSRYRTLWGPAALRADGGATRVQPGLPLGDLNVMRTEQGWELRSVPAHGNTCEWRASGSEATSSCPGRVTTLRVTSTFIGMLSSSSSGIWTTRSPWWAALPGGCFG